MSRNVLENKRYTEDQVEKKWGHFKQVFPVEKNTMLGYPGYRDTEYIEFARFIGVMTPDYPSPISRGRSSTKLHVTDEFDNQYEMFMKDIGYFMSCIDGGRVHGIWNFRKQGANYGMYCERGYAVANYSGVPVWKPIPTWHEEQDGTKLTPVNDFWNMEI